MARGTERGSSAWLGRTNTQTYRQINIQARKQADSSWVLAGVRGISGTNQDNNKWCVLRKAATECNGAPVIFQCVANGCGNCTLPLYTQNNYGRNEAEGHNLPGCRMLGMEEIMDTFILVFLLQIFRSI